MISIKGYQSPEKIYESANSLICRTQREEDGRPVILKIMKNEYPAPEEIAGYRREYEITRRFQTDGVIRAHSLEHFRNRMLIVYEDFGGISLKILTESNPFDFKQIIVIAAKVSGILSEVHGAGVIHKDINPSNLVMNPDTGELKLIDFGISSVCENGVLPQNETESSEASNTLEGTLAYISPEQTGRMNRVPDYRTDFYSMGATLYEMLTQKPLFDADDPMEIVHCHLAKQPVPPHELCSDIPRAVSDIIMKLVAKNPRDRYRSARGIQADFEKCLELLNTEGKISDFSIGARDISDRFQIPRQLYGRDEEIETLTNGFEKAKAGEGELILISGYSGIGKSALVQEFYRRLTRSLQEKKYQIIPCLISGKFEQFQKNIPYSAIVSAFSGLVQQLLTESNARLERWRDNLLSALGPNARLITDIIPQAERIMGPQPPVSPLPPAEAQNRFNLTFQNFVRVFTRPEHPLVLFLDDLQWADAASMKMIRLLVTAREQQSLFLIGSYRVNEVDKTHPLINAIADIEEAGVRVRNISLSALKLSQLKKFISDTLNCDPDKASFLAALMLTKTGGNPFFMTEFFKLLYTEGLLTFDFRIPGWTWDPQHIQAQAITGNVAELMTRKIQKLPPEIQRILYLGACIGNPFDIRILSAVCENSPDETAKLLGEAAAEGLISADQGEAGYSFSHDRIREAAYFLESEREREMTHKRIGQFMLGLFSDKERESNVFDIVSQMNQGTAFLHVQSERDELAGLNLIAGKKAKASAAYEPALIYLQTGIRLLGEDRWMTHYGLSLDLHAEAAEAAYLAADFRQTYQISEQILLKGRTLLDREKAYEVRLRALMAQNKLTEAIELALNVLKPLGMKLPENPNKFHIFTELIRTKLALRGKKIERLIDLPEMSDPYKLAISRILSVIGHAAYIAMPNLMPIIVLRVVSMSVTHGCTPFTPYSYAAYGLILCAFLNDADQGYRFGYSSLMLMNRSPNKTYECRTVNIYNTFVRHWKEHTRKTLKPLAEAYQSGLESGDTEYAAITAFVFAGYSFWTGRNLNAVEEEIRRYIPAIRRLRQETALHWYEMVWQACLNLAGTPEEPCRLVGEAFDEKKMLPVFMETNERVGICYLHFLKLFLCYIFCKYSQAIENSDISEKYLEGQLGTMTVPIFYCYDSLSRLALYRESSKAEKRRILRRVAKNQKRLKRLADHAPVNHLHRWYLVEAERENISGNDFKAADYYKLAVRFAGEHQYIQDEAVANELAAAFYLKKGDDRIAQVYIRESRYCYMKWGATAKLRQLEETYPLLLSNALPSAPGDWRMATASFDVTRRDGPRSLDMTTVIKFSQAISGEIVLETLLKKMMRIVIENAGAQKGLLILEKDGELMIAAQSGADKEIGVESSLPASGEYLPEAVLNFAVHTRESIVLNDAAHHHQFANDPYIFQHLPKSVLCVPLINQGKLTGVLYLENNLTTGAFTPDRVEVLNLLSSQMAISVENARLYENVRDAARLLEEYNKTLEEKVRQRTHALNDKNIRLNEALEEVEAYNKEITGSIEYARRIQQSLLPNTEEIKRILPHCFIIWMPRDIVGGDIFFADHCPCGCGFIVAVIDCTGHSVPGALMTMIALSGMRRIIKDEGCHDPSQILKRLNFIVKKTLQQDTEYALSDDGLDAGICLIRGQGARDRGQEAGCMGQGAGHRAQVSEQLIIQHPATSNQHPASRTPHPASGIQNPASRTQHPASRTPHPESRNPHPASRTPHPASSIQQPASSIQKPAPHIPQEIIFAGAKLPLICVYNNEVSVIKADRQSIGYRKSDLDFNFTNHSIPVRQGMCFYLSTDGFTDQLGGEKNIRFGKARFRELLRDNAHLPFDEQRERVFEAFEAYRGGDETRDDVTVLGFGFR